MLTSASPREAAVRTLVIVPAYNEARSLPALLPAIRAALPEADICVVDDGSADRTAAVSMAEGAIVLRHAVNLGIGGAVQAGYLWARDHGYDVAVQVDGDGQHDPLAVPVLIAPIAEDRADLVIGSRFLSVGGFQSTLLRRIGIRYLSWFIALRCGARVSDPTSGLRAAGRRAIDLFARTYPSDYPEPESIPIAIRAGLRVNELPANMAPRQHGRSSIGAAHTLYYLIKVSIALILLPQQPDRRDAR